MSYTDVFGGQTIQPTQLSLLDLALTANVVLDWPIEQAPPGSLVMADTIAVTPDAAGHTITLPDATTGSNGNATLFQNLGADTFTVLDHGGNTVLSVASGEAWYLYLRDNSTEDGTWEIFQFGAGASSANAAALAGAGLKAITTTLNVQITPNATSSTPVTIMDADRATALVWTGGVGVADLPDPATLGADWFMYVRNGGTGTLTLTPAAGAINGQTDLAFAAGDSAIVVSDGTDYFTIGYGQSLAGQFDFISINVAGSGDYTLSANELNRIAYRFTGAIGIRNIIVPNTVQQYWVDNQTTGGTNFVVKTAAGSGVDIAQGTSRVLYCDGIDVVTAEDGIVPQPVNQGGTGLTSVAQGDLLYGGLFNTIAKLPTKNDGFYALTNTGGLGTFDPAWAKVNLTDMVEDRLPYANIDEGSALSVLGVSGNSVADLASIVATLSGQVLRVNPAGDTLEFGALDLASPNSVTGQLPAANGGSGQTTVAQGDLLYGSGVDTWSRLAKSTVNFQALMNQGVNNNPGWDYMRFRATSAVNSDHTFALTDAWAVIPHTGVPTQTWTIPPSGTTNFPAGTAMILDNRNGAGAITLRPGTGVTLSGHGQQDTASAGDFVLQPMYKLLLIKASTDLWIFITDQPSATTVFGGYVNDDADAENLPSGWTASVDGANLYTVTHNLALGTPSDLAISGSPLSALNHQFNLRSVGANSFTVDIISDSGPAVRSDWMFTAVLRS